LPAAAWSTDQRGARLAARDAGCFITGQAAGVAAAMCADDAKSVRAADVNELQRRLKAFGAYLPNA
jgi:hypothetical protein